MNERILIDIGSSTVKVYKQTSNSVFLLLARSIAFKNEFDPVKGISEGAKKELYELITEIKEKNKF